MGREQDRPNPNDTMPKRKKKEEEGVGQGEKEKKKKEKEGRGDEPLVRLDWDVLVFLSRSRCPIERHRGHESDTNALTIHS